MKNFVGANVRKEYLPHHRIGDKTSGGDEYNKKSYLLRVSSVLLDKSNHIRQSSKLQSMVLFKLSKCLAKFDKTIVSKEKNREGSWYGNDTIWRTILDINKIILYCDKKGILRSKPQRKIINFADMVVVGEGEGPLMPSPKYCGIVVFSDNIEAFDLTICQIMGFDYKKIPTFKNIEFNRKNIKIISNNNDWNNAFIDDISYKKSLQIKPSDGWKDHIEIE